MTRGVSCSAGVPVLRSAVSGTPPPDTYEQEGVGQLHTLNLYWRVSIIGEWRNPMPADDIAELAWFERDALPPRQELAFDCVPRALAAWKALSPG